MRSRHLFSAWSMICLLSVGASAAKITGPDKVPLGSLVELKVADLGTRSASWMVVQPVDMNYRTYDGGSTMVFAAGCQAMRVVVVLTVIDWEKHQFNQTKRVIDIGEGPGPGPGPNPPPPPPPPPVKPEEVTIVYESEQNTPAFRLALQGVQAYADAHDLHYYLADKDMKDKSGRTPHWLETYKQVIAQKGLKLPVMFLAGGGDIISVQPFPLDAKDAIAIIKKHGG